MPKICEALQYAHDEGIVHRDIKKANILIDEWHKGQAQKRGGGRTVLSLDEQTAEEIRHLFAVLAAP